MRHRIKGKKLGRDTGHRKALRNEHGNRFVGK